MAIPLNRPTPPQGGSNKAVPEKFELPSFDDELPVLEEKSSGGGRGIPLPGNLPKHLDNPPASKGGLVNPYDDEEGDPFSQIDFDDDDLYNNDDFERTPEAKKPSVREEQVSESPVTENNDTNGSEGVDPAIAPKKKPRGWKVLSKKADGLPKNHTEDTFIDEKEVKLKPFGSTRSRKFKVNEADSRKNMRTNSVLVKGIVIALFLVIAGSGVKNAFFPPESLTETEIAEIVSASVGETGFPLERGAGVASNFMKAYLSIDSTNDAGRRALSYYYNGGDMTGEADILNRSVFSGFEQVIILGPSVYESTALTPSSARYTVGALVEAELKDSDAPADGSTAKWSFFNVNVYYDEETDGFLVTPDSPTIIPGMDVVPISKLPQPAKLGSGTVDSDLTAAVQPVVLGFIKGYAISGIADHDSIDQYTISDPPVELLKGLEKRYILAGEDSSAIIFEAYPTSDPNEIKVAVKVRWRDSLTSEAQVDYTSNYVMTLQKQTNGKYLVSKFAPMYYAPEQK